MFRGKVVASRNDVRLLFSEGLLGCRDVCESYTFLGSQVCGASQRPIPHDRNYVGRSLVSICSRRGHEGLLCKFSAAFISVAIVAVTVVAFPWPAPSAGAATSDLGVPLGETSA